MTYSTRPATAADRAMAALHRAAPPVRRFGTVRQESRPSQYAIIGTLASFGRAMLTGWATLALAAILPQLGIPDFTP